MTSWDFDISTSWRLPLLRRQISRSHAVTCVSDSDAAAFDGLGELVCLVSHVELFGQGEKADHVYRLIQGRIEIDVVSVPARKIAMRTVYPGGMLGLSAALSGGTYEGFAVASIPSIVQKIRVEPFLNLLHGSSHAAAFVARALTEEYLDLLKHAASPPYPGLSTHVL